MGTELSQASASALRRYQKAKSLFEPIVSVDRAPVKGSSGYRPYDRKAYHERVATYSMGSWAGIPHGDILTPLELARWGLQCSARYTVQCVYCLQTFIYAAPVSSGRDSAQKFLKKVQCNHIDNCPWPKTPCPADFGMLPVRSPGAAFLSFMACVTAWKDSGLQPNLHVFDEASVVVMSGLSDTERQELLLAVAARLSWAEDQPATEAVVALALTGWVPSRQALVCSLCSRTWPISLPHLATRKATGRNEVEGDCAGSNKRHGGELDLPPVKKSVVVPSPPHLIASHLHFCPWGRTGWLSFRALVVGHVMSWPGARETGLAVPNRDQFRQVDKVLDSVGRIFA